MQCVMVFLILLYKAGSDYSSKDEDEEESGKKKAPPRKRAKVKTFFALRHRIDSNLAF
jgi:hypothetical protein